VTYAKEKVVVVGMGRTALAAVRLLLREGAVPFVTEHGPAESVAPYRAELDELGVLHECGGHSPAAFDGAATVVLSPGVPPSISALEQARVSGIPVLGEMEFAFPFCRAPILAVTGTNGKTTTTELLRALVDSCGHSVLLAGNNAFPLSAAVMVDPPPDYVVLEVSSYQLQNAARFRPWIGAVLNLTPDHLARHGTMESYAADKARLFAAQGPGDIAVLNADDSWTAVMGAPEGVTVRRFSLTERRDNGLWLDGDVIREGDTQMARTGDTRLPGRHNLENVLAALTMMRAGGFDWEGTLAGLRAFEGVEHRIERVADIGGVTFYNDSKSTNIDSLRVALESFDGPLVLIAGGQGKGADYRVLRQLVGRRVKRMVTIGEDAPLLEEAFGDLVSFERATAMDDAVRCAASQAKAGDVVLLSPACASFDMFRDFEERGRVFKDRVRQLQEETLS
jgi:UDP-N-acetylmuramoylalanine--D-glutamate ligase